MDPYGQCHNGLKSPSPDDVRKTSPGLLYWSCNRALRGRCLNYGGLRTTQTERSYKSGIPCALRVQVANYKVSSQNHNHDSEYRIPRYPIVSYFGPLGLLWALVSLWAKGSQYYSPKSILGIPYTGNQSPIPCHPSPPLGPILGP